MYIQFNLENAEEIVFSSVTNPRGILELEKKISRENEYTAKESCI